jgi:hypothetical protein
MLHWLYVGIDCHDRINAYHTYVWADVSRRGDSGAWVMAPSAQGPRWLGMLVGGVGSEQESFRRAAFSITSPRESEQQFRVFNAEREES